jgi:cytochrome c peroxidase
LKSIWTSDAARARRIVAGLATVGLCITLARGRGAIDPAVSFSADERRRILELSPLGLPPPDASNAVADDAAAARLGQTLFFEPRLSSGDVSCATCHVPGRGFTDGKRRSEGVGRGRRHTPSLWNVAYNRWLFWDGRADSLWSQALSPMESATEMAGDRLRSAHLVAGDSGLRSAYESVFGPLPPLSDRGRFPDAGHPVAGSADDSRSKVWSGMKSEDRAAVDRVFANLGKAIAAYERRLISRRAEFDRFAEALRAGRDGPALSMSARRGLKLFIGRAQCRVCHNGPNFTDGEFHNTGVPSSGEAGPADAGRSEGIALLLASPFNALSPLSDDRSPAAGSLLRFLRKTPDAWAQFKTPSLRNVARVAPYMHHGGLATVRDVLEFYSTRAGTVDPGPTGEKILIPLHLSPEELLDLTAFLEALTDEAIEPELMRAPEGGRSGTVSDREGEPYRTEYATRGR